MAKEGVIGDFLPITNKATLRLIERRGIVGVQPPLNLRFSLPHSMASMATKTWHSTGTGDLPMATAKLEEGDEDELLYYMCTELNRGQGAGLDPQLCTTKAVSEGGASCTETLIFVGNKHAERLATAATAMGRTAVLITLPATSDGDISACAKAVRERVAAIPPEKRAHSLIIYTLLDEKCT